MTQTTLIGTQRRRTRHSLFVAVLIALTAAAAAPADSITLRASVRLPADAESVHLADIATLDGAEADALAETVIADAPDGGATVELNVQAVRERLTEAGVNWGRVNLSGRRVIVRSRSGSHATAPVAMTATEIVVATPADPGAAQASIVPTPDLARRTVDEPTIRGLVTRHVVAGLGRAADDVRIRFDDSDEAYLGRLLEGARFEVEPLSSYASDRVELVIRMWDGTAVTEEFSLTLRPTVRTTVSRLRHDVGRRETITAASVEQTTEWLAPSQAQLVSDAATIAGHSAARHMRAGEQVREHDVERPTLVNRGDLVTVRCLVGGHVISMTVEARDDGFAGDRIEFRHRGHRDTFLATVTAPGEAVLELH